MLRDRQPTDVMYQSGEVTAFLALGRWAGNPVGVAAVPNGHFENIYDLPVRYALPLHCLARAVQEL